MWSLAHAVVAGYRCGPALSESPLSVSMLLFSRAERSPQWLGSDVHILILWATLDCHTLYMCLHACQAWACRTSKSLCDDITQLPRYLKSFTCNGPFNHCETWVSLEVAHALHLQTIDLQTNRQCLLFYSSEQSLCTIMVVWEQKSNAICKVQVWCHKCRRCSWSGTHTWTDGKAMGLTGIAYLKT